MGDLISEGCEFHINAISKDEMKAFLKAHLKQEHDEDLDTLDPDQLEELETKISAVFN